MHAPLPAALRKFVDDELARAPSLIDRVLFLALNQLRQPRERLLSPTEAKLHSELAHGLSQHRERCAAAFVEALGDLVTEDLARRYVDVGSHGSASEPSRLTLMDETDLAADVELARTIEQIQDVAEWEQRELQTFTSTLAGLDHVEPTSNPLRAEIMAKAFWYAADALPMARGFQVLFMHVGGESLAQALKMAYAASATRLESMGIEPSKYRTGVPPTPNASADRQAYALESRAPARPPAGPPADLAPPGMGVAPPALRQGADDLHAARAMVDRQVTEMVNRMFSAIEAERGLHPELRELIRRLKDSTLRMALKDPDMLDEAEHPAWHLLDRLAYQSSCRPNLHDPRLTAYISFASGLVDGVLSSGEQTAEHFKRCVDRLDAFAQRQFREQLDEASTEIARLETQERSALGGDGEAGDTLDVPTMDTVPADLVDLVAGSGDAEPASQWVDEQHPGRWYRVFVNGRWTLVQLLWHSERRAQWLFAGEAVEQRLALTRRAFVQMRTDGLIQPFSERRLMRRAADEVLQSMGGPGR
ncbi:MAG: DUF1631 domain-containing protein [Ideonella sp.]|jgi:hypothetical protein|nr:DUF1631 domain-containing protein [Ideonella sp.]